MWKPGTRTKLNESGQEPDNFTSVEFTVIISILFDATATDSLVKFDTRIIRPDYLINSS